MKRTCCGAKLQVEQVILFSLGEYIRIRTVCLWCCKRYNFIKNDSWLIAINDPYKLIPTYSKQMIRVIQYYRRRQKQYEDLIRRTNILLGVKQ